MTHFEKGPYQIEINPEDGFIRITHKAGAELYWNSTEWEEDPELIFCIAQAICVALTNRPEMDATSNAWAELLEYLDFMLQ